MNLFGLMDTSGSAMEAERMRAEIVAVNMANAETTRTADGKPYRRQMVVFEAIPPQETFGQSLRGMAHTNALSFSDSGSASSGVRIASVIQDPGLPLRRYDPGHPDADANGYVEYPDINPVTEMVDLMGATRAYGLNGSAVQAEKSMIGSALEIAKG